MRPKPKPGETYKAAKRRTESGWFEKYAPPQLSGIDVGCQRDPLNATFRRWDLIFGDGDATYMKGVPDESFHTVYISHLIEHIADYATALKNWWRILRPEGNLILVAPHRDLYEKQKTLPSRWNRDHKWMFLPETDEPPHTLSLKRVVTEAIPDGEIVSFEILDDGFDAGGPDEHSIGEYSIECVIFKKA